MKFLKIHVSIHFHSSENLLNISRDLLFTLSTMTKKASKLFV